ncbi:MAG: RnfH family protein [Candidatus Competibacteraceae bacterium]|nr:RnfH family protein [Candidatus Competibacteraceae bacterium]
MTNATMIRVEVAYALPDEQVIVPIDIPEGTTLEQAIILSRIQDRFPEIDLTTAKVGVFGKLSHLAVQLRAGDRVEIYRPLLADPKTVRKKRAAASVKKDTGMTVK